MKWIPKYLKIFTWTWWNLRIIKKKSAHYKIDKINGSEVRFVCLYRSPPVRCHQWTRTWAPCVCGRGWPGWTTWETPASWTVCYRRCPTPQSSGTTSWVRCTTTALHIHVYTCRTTILHNIIYMSNTTEFMDNFLSKISYHCIIYTYIYMLHHHIT